MATHRSERRLLLLTFLVPGIAYILLLRIVPAMFTIGMSFTDWNLRAGHPPSLIGFANYAALFHDASLLASVGRTLLFVVVVTAIELVLGLATALFLTRRFAGYVAVRTALLIPMVITPAVVGMVWYIMFHATIGPLNWFLSWFGFGPYDFLSNPWLALPSVMVADIWHWTPFMFLLALAALQAVPKEFVENAEVNGARYWQTLRMVILPTIRDTLMVAVVLRSMEAFEIFAEPFVMTGGGPGDATDTLSMHIYRSAFSYFNMGYAGATIVLSICILVALYGCYLRFADIR